MASMGHMPLSVLLWEVGVVEKSMQSIDRGRKVSKRKKKEVLLTEWGGREGESMGEAETTDGHH